MFDPFTRASGPSRRGVFADVHPGGEDRAMPVVPSDETGQPPPGAEIHVEHPFLPPEDQRSPVRRLRGRLTAPVTLWTSELATSEPSDVAGERAGLPVSAVLVVDGEPGLVLGLLDEDSELWEVLHRSERFAVSVLRWEHRGLADAFAGVVPAPGGAFALSGWTSTPWGPVPDGVSTWAGCRLREAKPIGWALAVEAEIEHVELGDDPDPLLHRRGRYLTLPT